MVHFEIGDRTIQQHQGNIGLEHFFDVFPRTVAWHDDQAVDAFVDKHLDQVVQFSGVLIRAAENNRIFILVGFVFDATGDIGKKGLEISERITPIVLERPLRRLRAALLG